MGKITFDRFDGGLLLARPSSVAPANSLANLFNMNVQPGGWLRGRESWRNINVYLGTQMDIPNTCHGLESNGGYLWTFGLAEADLPLQYSNNSTAGRLYPLETFDADYVAAGHFGLAAGKTGRLVGVTPWDTGFLVVMKNETDGTYYRATFRAAGGVGGGYSAVFRLDIMDVNLPNSGLMVTAGARVFAISNDGQTVRFSGVGSVVDWSSSGNAGFLPVAQHFGAGQRAMGLGIYQGKLAVFTDKSVQLWNIDPDPTAMAIDRVIDGVGTKHHRSIVSFNTDLLFLSDSGVRSLTTLSNSLFPTDVDVGLPIGPITKPSPLIGGTGTQAAYSRVLAVAATPFKQYWIAAPDTWTFGSGSEYGWAAWSYSRVAKLNAWAWHGGGGSPRAKIKGWAALGNRMFARTDQGTRLLVMAPDVFGAEQVQTIGFASCSMETQWLDFKLPGKEKSIYGIDFDGKNVLAVSVLTSTGGSRSGILADTVPIGSNQAGWTYGGEMLPVTASGTDFKLQFTGTNISELQINRLTLYFDEL